MYRGIGEVVERGRRRRTRVKSSLSQLMQTSPKSTGVAWPVGIEAQVGRDARQRLRAVEVEHLLVERAGEERVVDAVERVAERRVLREDDLVQRGAGVAVLQDPHLPARGARERPQHGLRHRERVVGDERDRPVGRAAGRAGAERGDGHDRGEERGPSRRRISGTPVGWMASRTPRVTRTEAGRGDDLVADAARGRGHELGVGERPAQAGRGDAGRGAADRQEGEGAAHRADEPALAAHDGDAGVGHEGLDREVRIGVVGEQEQVGEQVVEAPAADAEHGDLGARRGRGQRRARARDRWRPCRPGGDRRAPRPPRPARRRSGSALSRSPITRSTRNPSASAWPTPESAAITSGAAARAASIGSGSVPSGDHECAHAASRGSARTRRHRIGLPAPA